jgi:impB/mucB/samB family C-terminal domain
VVICVVGRGWGSRETEQVGADVLELVPRVALGSAGEVWADGRGLDAVGVATRIVERLRVRGLEPGCGVATTPVAAYAAAIDASVDDAVRVVGAGMDREYLADRPLSILKPAERLRVLLEGVGVETCGELAGIPAEAVEVRFGAEAVGLWRKSRADDDRRLFHGGSSDRPQVSLDFIDYVVTDPEQLAFTANSLLSSVSETLTARGAHARRIEMVLGLANGETWRKVLRPARPTASRAVWLRLVRRVLERLSVPDAVAGMRLDVLETETASAIQGDLFDAGFATSAAVEAALMRLIESQGPVVVRPESTNHPLSEKRTEFIALDAEAVAEWSGTPSPVEPAARAGLTLQMLPEPRSILVETVTRRDHEIPVRYRDREWRRFETVAGPERVSGGRWEEPYAREYFRGVTGDGQLVWLYRDACAGQWYLHGWWD